MLNSQYKKEALEGLKVENEKYQATYNATMKDIIALHEMRMQAVVLIKKIEHYVSSVANKPKEFEKIIRGIKINYQNFEGQVKKLELENKSVNKVAGSVTGAGVVAGAGVAAFGPTAAMAVATTFGTASTGTAIATLSGAAATNAALAWLGGGALVAGGGGMSAGTAFLALAGPVGWVIGAGAIAGGGYLASSKNKKVAEEAEESTRKIKEEILKISTMRIKVNRIRKEINDLGRALNILLNEANGYPNRNYRAFSERQLNHMKRLLNITFSLSAKLSEKID